MPPESAEALVDNLAPLTNYIRRRIRYFEAIGDVQPGDLDAEDIVGLTYLAAGQRLQREAAAGGEHGYPWLRKVADHILEQRVRRIRAQRRASTPDEAIKRALPELIPDPSAPIPDEVAEDDELQRALARLVGELPDEVREPFLMVVADGFRVEEVAALEQVPAEEVRRRVADATLRLRERLAREYAGSELLPLERLFRLVERLEPGADAYARARQNLAQPAPPTAPPA